MGFISGVFLALALQAGPVETLAGPVFNPSICAKKRVDPCGCHHVYGIRHCHPNRKGDHCEAPVKAQVADKSQAPEKAQPADKTQAPAKKKLDPKKSVSM